MPKFAKVRNNFGGSVRIYSKSGIRLLAANKNFSRGVSVRMVKPTVTERKAMSSIYYSAAWTECGCLISCWHHHETVGEAVLCIRSAGGYVVAVETGVMRCLTAEEEAEFQCVVHPPCANSPLVQTALAAPAEAAVSDSSYAVMTRIRVGDRWTWTIWMRFETYAEAVVHARNENLPPRGEGETLLEFVLRFLASQTQNQP